MNKNIYTLVLVIILVLISPLSINHHKPAIDAEKSIVDWKLQTGTKLESVNCVIANITTIDNNINKTNTTVDEMREFYGRDGGLDTFDAIKLLKALDLNVAVRVSPINSSTLSTYINENDFILSGVNIRVLYKLPARKKELNHSVILKGINKNKAGDDEFYNITIIDPNNSKPVIRRIEEFKKATTVGTLSPLTIYLLINEK